jgi:hypothetical protein
MANRQRRIDEEKARIMVKYLKKKRLIDEKEAKLREISKQEKQQKLLDENRQLEKERFEEAEKDRLAKVAHDIMIQKRIEIFAPVFDKLLSSALDSFFGAQSKENSQEKEKANTNPSNDSIPEAD